MNSPGRMGVPSLGNLTGTTSTAWEHTNGPMDEYIEAIGKTIKCMARAHLHGAMDVSTWENISRISNKAMESFPGQMGGVMTVCGIRGDNMAKGRLLARKE